MGRGKKKEKKNVQSFSAGYFDKFGTKNQIAVEVKDN